jgi:hypothetical protein
LHSTSEDGPTIAASLLTPRTIEGSIDSHVIHPVFVDAAMQSLFALFLPENGNPTDQAFLPVRFEAFDVFHPSSIVVSTRAAVRSHSSRSLLADLQFFGSDGQLVASCSGARFRAAHLKRHSFDRARTLVQTWIPRALPGRKSVFENRHGDVTSWIREALAAVPESSQAKRYALEGDALMDMLCSAFALEALKAYADRDGIVSLGDCLTMRSVAPEMSEYFRRLALMLEQDGWIQTAGRDLWKIPDQNELPQSREIWLTLVADFPEKAARIGPSVRTLVECVLATQHGFVETRMVWGLFHLATLYSRKDVDDACGMALEIHGHSYREVKRILESTSTPTKQEEKRKHAFTRDMNEYTNHFKTKEQANDRHDTARPTPSSEAFDRRAGASHSARRNEKERAN